MTVVSCVLGTVSTGSVSWETNYTLCSRFDRFCISTHHQFIDAGMIFMVGSLRKINLRWISVAVRCAFSSLYLASLTIFACCVSQVHAEPNNGPKRLLSAGVVSESDQLVSIVDSIIGSIKLFQLGDQYVEVEKGEINFAFFSERGAISNGELSERLLSRLKPELSTILATMNFETSECVSQPLLGEANELLVVGVHNLDPAQLDRSLQCLMVNLFTYFEINFSNFDRSDWRVNYVTILQEIVYLGGE